MATASQLKVFLAGRIEVESNGASFHEARFPGRQGRLVFAYLVAERGRPVPRDELAEAVWGNAPPATWEKALSVIVSKLRALLADAGVDGSTLTSAFGCYRLELTEGSWVDVIVATDAAREAEAALTAGDADAATDAAAVTESLLRQTFLPGEDGAWVEDKRREFGDVRGRALDTLSEAALRSGDASEAAKWAEQTIALAPFRETGYRRLMEAHVAGGNRAEALRVYEQCRRLLAEELGTYPSPETESIYRGLLEEPSARSAAAPTAQSTPPSDADASGQATTRPRRRLVLAVACAALAAVVIAAAGLLFRGDRDEAAAGVMADSVGVFRAESGRPSGQIPVGPSPGALTAGSGSIWIAHVDTHSVSRVDPAKQVVIQKIQVGNGPAGIASGGGFVWVANSLDGTVWRIDPRTDSVSQRIRVGNGPAGLAVDSRFVWVANSRDGTVTRIDRKTGKPLAPIRVDQSADGVAAGGDSVWVTSAASGKVSRIDARTGRVVGTVPSGNGADAVAFGLGSLWVANSFDGTVTRIDPATDTVRAKIPVGDGPNGIAIAPGAVWVSNELSGTLSRIDPDRNVVVDTVTTGNRPQGLVHDAGALFVAVGASGVGHRGGRLTLLTSSGDLGYLNPHLDPALAYSQTDWQVIALTNDGLTGYGRVGGTAGTELVPDLAVSLPPATDGGRSYTFRLRPGIRYSTGRLVRPEDFRRAIERGLLSDGSGWSLSGILGASTCNKKTERCDLARGIVTDRASNTVTFHLRAPDPDFLYKLALPAAFAVPAGTPLHPRAFVPATGPYEVAAFDNKRGLRLVRNPRFREWSAEAQPRGFPDEIVERVKGSADAHITAAVSGSADVASVAWNAGTPSPATVATVRTQHAGQLKLNPSKITWYLSLNTQAPPFDNVAARRALNFAVDRRRLRDLTIGRELGDVTCQALPPSLAGYRRYCPYTVEPSKDGTWTAPDLERARRLVRASGTAGQTVTFWIPTFLQFRPSAGRYVVSVLERLGYKARYRFVPYPRTLRDDVQITVNGWSPDFAAPGGFIDPTLTCAGPLNLAAFCNPSIDRAIGRAHSLHTTDPGAESQRWAQIDRKLTDQAPWLAYANGVVLDVVSNRVGNYQYNPQWGTLLGQLWVR